MSRHGASRLLAALAVLCLFAASARAQSCPSSCSETMKSYTIARPAEDPRPLFFNLTTTSPYECAWNCANRGPQYKFWLKQADNTCRCFLNCSGTTPVMAINTGGLVAKCPKPPAPPPPPISLVSVTKMISTCGSPASSAKVSGGAWVQVTCGGTTGCSDAKQYCCFNSKEYSESSTGASCSETKSEPKNDWADND